MERCGGWCGRGEDGIAKLIGLEAGEPLGAPAFLVARGTMGLETSQTLRL